MLGGKQIQKRQAVIAVFAAANRDPERFPDPDKLDLRRTDNRHVAFAWGAHYCFGAPLARMGYQDMTKKELMPHNVQAVEETGAKILVTACAECYRAFARDYREWGGNPPYSVFHISHYVEKLIREKRIAFTKPLAQKVAFHDACHMSRVSGVYEPPRQALKFIRDLKVLEILPSKEDALCSGAAGGFPAVFPEQAAGVAQRRLDAAEDTGATTLVTTCPHAELHFEDVASRRNMNLSIVDLAEMLAQAL